MNTRSIRLTKRAASLSALVAIALMFLAPAAQAQTKKPSTPAANSTYEIAQIVITARPTKPSAVVELARILPEVEIAKIRQPFLSKIEEALFLEPF